MRCFGRTAKVKRCKNHVHWYYPFCRHHWWQPLVLILITVPAILSSYGGIYQDIVKPFRQPSNRPEVEFEFAYPHNATFKIRNVSETISEEVLVCFGIMDLDSKRDQFLPLKCFDISYVNPKGAKGPWKVLGRHEKKGHQYFGMMTLNCKGCIFKRYFVFLDQKNPSSSFTYQDIGIDLDTINFNSVANSPAYLNRLIPINERIKILNDFH